MRASIGLGILLLTPCAAKSPVTAPVGTQARVGSVILGLEPTVVVPRHGRRRTVEVPAHVQDGRTIPVIAIAVVSFVQGEGRPLVETPS